MRYIPHFLRFAQGSRKQNNSRDGERKQSWEMNWKRL